MNRISKWFLFPLSSKRLDTTAAQIVCWLAGISIMVIGVFKLCSLPLSETGLFFGMLSILTVTLLFFLIGLVLPIATASFGRNDPSQC
jgi:hypothetical protein